MIYLNSRYLAEKLEIKLAKWKRWAREFLDPDPLGGLQSGYARQFSYKDAFRVYMGGHLVGALKFAVPEARRILSDLDDWLNKNEFYALPVQHRMRRRRPCHIYIFEPEPGQFGYVIRCFAETNRHSSNTLQEARAEQELIGISRDSLAMMDTITHARIIFINALHAGFLSKINGS